MELQKPSWPQASGLAHKPPHLFYPHLSLRTSSANHATRAQRRNIPNQATNRKIRSLSLPERTRPITLYLSQCDRVLRSRNKLQMDCIIKAEIRGYPARQTDALLNGVSVPGWLGERSPWACSHQCKGRSTGVRYKALGP